MPNITSCGSRHDPAESLSTVPFAKESALAKAVTFYNLSRRSDAVLDCMIVESPYLRLCGPVEVPLELL